MNILKFSLYKRKVIIYFLILVSNLLFGLPEIQAQPLAIDSILIIIEKNNPLLKEYDSRINASRAMARGAKSLDPPQLGAGFFMTPYNSELWKSDEMNNGMGSFMLSAGQMFDNPYKLRARAAFMDLVPGVEIEMKGAISNELYSMAKMRFTELQIFKKKLKLISEIESLLMFIVQSAEIRYTYGKDKVNSYFKATAMLGELQEMKIRIETEIRNEKIALNSLMNRSKELDFDIDTNLNFKKLEFQIVDTATLVNNRSDYKALSKNIQMVSHKQYYEYSKRLPDFGIKYDHMMGFGKQARQFSLMGMVTIPFVPWSSKMYRSSGIALGDEVERIKNQQISLLNDADGVIHRLRISIINKKQQMDLYEKTIIPAIKNNYQATLLAYEENSAELFVLLDAFQNLKLIQLGYLDLVRDLLKLQVEFEKQLEMK